MTLETIAQIASIIASVAVVLTLIFIALQMRQTLQLTKMSAAQTATVLLSQNYGRVIEHADLAEILSRDVEREEDFDKADMLRMTNFVAVQFRYYEMLYAHMRAGIFDPDLWAGVEQRLHSTLDLPRIRVWWDENRLTYAPSFVTLVDKVYREEARKDGEPDTTRAYKRAAPESAALLLAGDFFPLLFRRLEALQLSRCPILAAPSKG